MLRIISYSTGALQPPSPSKPKLNGRIDEAIPPWNRAAALRLSLRDGSEAQRVIYSFQHKGWREEN